jgi:hypothetical protein
MSKVTFLKNNTLVRGSVMTEALRNEGSVWQGLLLCWGINYMLTFSGCYVVWFEAERPGGSNAVIHAASVLTFSIGLLQLLYVIPVCRAMNKNGKIRTLKGVIIAASITALLNVAWLVLKATQ